MLGREDQRRTAGCGLRHRRHDAAVRNPRRCDAEHEDDFFGRVADRGSREPVARLCVRRTAGAAVTGPAAERAARLHADPHGGHANRERRADRRAAAGGGTRPQSRRRRRRASRGCVWEFDADPGAGGECGERTGSGGAASQRHRQYSKRTERHRVAADLRPHFGRRPRRRPDRDRDACAVRALSVRHGLERRGEPRERRFRRWRPQAGRSERRRSAVDRARARGHAARVLYDPARRLRGRIGCGGPAGNFPRIPA